MGIIRIRTLTFSKMSYIGLQLIITSYNISYIGANIEVNTEYNREKMTNWACNSINFLIVKNEAS
jgi:hypothetical protein